jgi:hypothetical protein
MVNTMRVSEINPKLYTKSETVLSEIKQDGFFVIYYFTFAKNKFYLT